MCWNRFMRSLIGRISLLSGKFCLLHLCPGRLLIVYFHLPINQFTTRLEPPTILTFVRIRQPNSLSSICLFHSTLLSFIFFLVFLIFPVGSLRHVDSILSRVLLQISSAVLTKLSLACFPPSLGTTSFRHETIPICVHSSSF